MWIRKIGKRKNMEQMEEKGGRNLWEEYKTTRNEYVRIWREESNFERNIIEKCKIEPKLFYRYINGKMKSKGGVDKLKVEGTVYKDAF